MASYINKSYSVPQHKKKMWELFKEEALKDYKNISLCLMDLIEKYLEGKGYDTTEFRNRKKENRK